jgi:hypothetical protein
MRRVLVAWVGRTDLRASTESEAVGMGPMAQALYAHRWAQYAEGDGASELSGSPANIVGAKARGGRRGH